VANSTAKSHIRIGTFQWFAAREDYGNLKVLADNVIDRHYPEAQREENPYRALLDGVIGGRPNSLPIGCNSDSSTA